MTDLFSVAALYLFVSIPEPDMSATKLRIESITRENDIHGHMILSGEGINGTISGSESGISTTIAALESISYFSTIRESVKYSIANQKPFHRMRINIKSEIVTLGKPEINPAILKGTYVEPKDWNDIISDPNIVVVDTRNKYEIELGTFKNAVNPNTTQFSEFPDYVCKELDQTKHKKVAMFCTGGIRCEKASSYMLNAGFDQVYHLKGGILKYLEEIPESQSLWDGECYVFDQRTAVKHRLEQGSYTLCRACRHPLHVAMETQGSTYYEDGVRCLYCHDKLTEQQVTRARERHRQMELASHDGEKHLGRNYSLKRKHVHGQTNIGNSKSGNDEKVESSEKEQKDRTSS